MKKLFLGAMLSIGLVNVLYSSAVETNVDIDITNNQAIDSLEEALKDESSGSFTSRFKIGYYGGIGYQASVKSEQETEISGLLLEGGVYTLFNPIKNFFDIEVGLNAKYNTGIEITSNDDETKYYSGLQQATVYVGPVFRFDEGRKAISIGLSKALYMKAVRTDEMKEKGIKENDIENGLGVYIEYQYMDLIGKNIGFSRLEVEQFDIISDKSKTEETVAGIIFGMKF